MPTARASAVINIPAAKIWAYIRDFGSHAPWVHGATSMELVDGTGTTVGVTRKFTLDNGPVLTEILTALDDTEYLLRYALVGEIPWPVSNVRGLIRLYSITANDTTMAERIVQFDTHLTGEQAIALTNGFSQTIAKSLPLLERSVPR